ncbi:MAG: lamin tail domain-containing protein, partial [Bacteroidetes bacterium]|nr:lamin tail domain-containing protein [Bacteroidota bacterium]
MKQKFLLIRQAAVVMMLLFVFKSNGQGYLRNSSTTSFTSGVTITEVAGWGNPPYDCNHNGTFDQNADEFTELTNTSNDTIDIGGWKIGDAGATYTIPSNSILYPGKKAIFFHGTGTGVTAGPTSFNSLKGDSNLNFNVQFSMGNGATNQDGIGVRNKSNLYISWVTNGASLNTGITSGGTLVGSVAKGSSAGSYSSPSASRQRQSYVDTNTTYILHPVVVGTYSWLDTTVSSSTSSKASPGRESNGRTLTPPDPASAPTISFGTSGSDSISISSLGNTLLGMRRIIVIRSGSAVNYVPTDGAKPSGISSDFTSATDQGSGNKVIYDGTATTNVVKVTNLAPSTTYYFAVYEYNGNSPTTDITYRTASNVAAGNTTTAASSTPNVQVSINPNSGTEAAGTAITVTATASIAVTGDQTIKVKMIGTGITAGDYSLSASDSNITILNGNTTGTLTLTILNDTLGEGTETGSVQIFSPSSGLILGTTTSANLTITDDEPTVSVSASTNATSEGSSAVTIYAVLSSQVSTPQKVNVAISGTGVNAADYSLSN